MKILIKNAYIITCDDDKPIIECGFLGTEDGKIKFVSEELPENFKADKIINANGNIVLPGFSNAHSHVAMTLLRSFSEGYKLQEWLNDKIFPTEDKLTSYDIGIGTELGIMESLRFGTTLINDTYFSLDEAMEAYVKSGINANISRCVMNFEEKDDFSDDYRVNEAIALFDKFHNFDNGRIKIEMFPHAIYTSSYGYLKYVSQKAKEKGMKVASHLCENQTEVDGSYEKFGKSPVEVYKELGLLDNVANMAHCVVLNDNDISLLKGHFITHNPTSNLKLSSGIADVIKYTQNGITVALGTDGASSNNNLSMIEEMHLAALLMCYKHDPSMVQPYDVIKMATLNGALAMDRHTKGILKAGYDADFIMLDVSEAYHHPVINPVNNLVYAASGTDVCLTVANGKILYENGEFKTLDEDRIKSEAAKIKERIY